MEKFISEGIIINSINFQDYDRIVTLFTPNAGLIKFLTKRALSNKQGNGNTTCPLNQIEVIYTKKRSEIYLSTEISIIDQHLNLRTNFQLLDTACDMLKVISKTQMPNKISTELYHLLLAFLKKLPASQNPGAIKSSFRLKTLLYEGLIRLHPFCHQCQKSLQNGFFYNHEFFCQVHAPKNAIALIEEEYAIFETLTYSRDFSQLSKIFLSPSLIWKIDNFFDQSIK